MYNANRFDKAIMKYTAALACHNIETELCVAVLGNRSMCYLRLEDYEMTLRYESRGEAPEKMSFLVHRDCQEATAIDPTYVKGLLRAAKALSELGREPEALGSYVAACKLEPHNDQVTM